MLNHKICNSKIISNVNFNYVNHDYQTQIIPVCDQVSTHCNRKHINLKHWGCIWNFIFVKSKSMLDFTHYEYPNLTNSTKPLRNATPPPFKMIFKNLIFPEPDSTRIWKSRGIAGIKNFKRFSEPLKQTQTMINPLIPTPY